MPEFEAKWCIENLDGFQPEGYPGPLTITYAKDREAEGLLSPFILQRLLIFQEAQEAKTEGTNTALSAEAARSGFIAVGALICLGLFNLFYNAQVDLWKARLNIRIESSLKGALLFRGGNTHGESAIYNVISFDVGDSVNMVWVILDIWSLPIQLVTAFTALFAQVARAHGVMINGYSPEAVEQ
eukprot:g16381.t1